jgi:hypothetical protein
MVLNQDLSSQLSYSTLCIGPEFPKFPEFLKDLT